MRVSSESQDGGDSPPASSAASQRYSFHNFPWQHRERSQFRPAPGSKVLSLEASSGRATRQVLDDCASYTNLHEPRLISECWSSSQGRRCSRHILRKVGEADWDLGQPQGRAKACSWTSGRQTSAYVSVPSGGSTSRWLSPFVISCKFIISLKESSPCCHRGGTGRKVPWWDLTLLWTPGQEHKFAPLTVFDYGITWIKSKPHQEGNYSITWINSKPTQSL